MTHWNARSHENEKEAKLPRRDWILLPMLGLLTICIVAGSTELIARRMFTESPPFIPECLVSGPAGRLRALPNTACWDKAYDTPRVKYKFNGCGYRAGEKCGPKLPGTYRIVMVGASVAMGLHVPEDKTIAALLSAELSRQTGRTVDLYNEGMVEEEPHIVALRSKEVLAAKPDMVLWVLAPNDIGSYFHVPLEPQIPAVTRQAGPLAMVLFRAKLLFATKSVPDVLRYLLITSPLYHFKMSATGFLLQNFLYESQSLYLKGYLMAGDDARYLRVGPNAEWQSALRQFDSDAAEIEGQARAAGVPLVVVLVPERAQATMISMGVWPAGYDPYKLDNELRSIITGRGGTYIDILPGYHDIPNPEQYYYPVDGHPDAQGCSIISRLLAKALTSGAVPALKVSAQ